MSMGVYRGFFRGGHNGHAAVMISSLGHTLGISRNLSAWVQTGGVLALGLDE